MANEKLRLLVWEGYAPNSQVKQFEAYISQKYKVPFTLKISYVTEPSEFYTALRFKAADVISPPHNLFKDERYNFITNKMLFPLNLELIPNYQDVIPSLQKADYMSQSEHVYGIPFAHGPYGLAYNTDIVPTPDSWNILWDEKYKKKYSLSKEYAEINVYTTALALGYNLAQLSQYNELNTPKFKRKLRALANNASHFWSGVDKADDLAGLHLSMVWGFSLPELNRRGENWKMASPKEGSMAWVDNWAINSALKDKPLHLKVAHEWLNFVISPKFQLEIVLREIGSGPVNISIKEQLTTNELEQHQMDNNNLFITNRILYPTINSIRNRNGINKLWKDALSKKPAKP